MEITEKERQMASQGIILSADVPNALFVEEGMGDGSYLCHAFLLPDYTMLQIFDDTDSVCKPITIDGKPVDRILVYSYIDKGDRKASFDTPSVYFENEEEEYYNYPALHSNKYEGLCLDVQAKLFFADFLKAYLKEKNDNTLVP